MRLAGITVALLLGATANARADVFVPADPPPNRALCAAAAGDVVATGRFDRSSGRVFEVSEGGGAWRRLLKARVDACPAAAAAADGTVAIAVGHRLWVRRGGGVAAPLRARPHPTGPPGAPGGWGAGARPPPAPARAPPGRRPG